MLDDDPRPVVPDPALRDGFREGHAEACVKHKDRIGQREGEPVAGDHGRELEVERPAMSLHAADICADGEEEERYPKEREESAELVGRACFIRDVEKRLAGRKGDHGAQLLLCGRAVGRGDVDGAVCDDRGR